MAGVRFNVQADAGFQTNGSCFIELCHIDDTAGVVQCRDLAQFHGHFSFIGPANDIGETNMTMQSTRISERRTAARPNLRSRLLQTTLMTAAALGLAAIINSAAAADIVTHAATDASVAADAKIARSPSVGAVVSGATLTGTSVDSAGLAGIDAQSSLSTVGTSSANLAETDPTQAALLPGEIQSETSAAAAIGTPLEVDAVDTDASDTVDTTSTIAGAVGATGVATVDAAETGVTASGGVSAAVDAAASTVGDVVGHVGAGLGADAGADAGTNDNSAGASADAGAEGDTGGGLGGGIGGALGGVGRGLGGVL